MRLGPLACALLLSAAPAVAEVATFGFEVLERRPQPRSNFVQGLEIRGDTLYVGTGGYGTSALREYDLATMRERRAYELPDAFFGEGITRLGDHIYQLTWLSGVGLVYDSSTLEPLRHWPLTTQGWGLTNNGSELIYSDGSHRLYFVSPDDLETARTLEVTLNGLPLPRLNELEWIGGEIWANVWGANQLVSIDPQSGAVTAIIDLRGLLPEEERRPDTDVLNGIARDPANGDLWVTGKRWPWLYRIALRPTETDRTRESR